MTEQGDSQLKKSADVSAQRVARIYAEALLNAADKNDAGTQIQGELHQLLGDIGRRDPYVRAFFTSGVIGKERREAALRRLVQVACCGHLIVESLQLAFIGQLTVPEEIRGLLV